jgi:hypothetical protein
MNSRQMRLAVLLAIAFAAITAVAFHAPIAQPPGYHVFADQRQIWGVPNFWNVVSNLPFFVVGWAGSVELARRVSPGALASLRAAYRWFFAGALLVAIGSAYYHLAPTDQSLVWDRLPMTIAFMAFFSVIIGEHISPRAGRLLLYPLLALGVVSVVYWHLSEEAGRGDLRPYLIVQFLPMLLIPLIMFLFPSRLSRAGLVWGALGAYGLAKLFELDDEWIYSFSQIISGHTLKHLAAAVGMYLLLVAIRQRRPLC